MKIRLSWFCNTVRAFLLIDGAVIHICAQVALKQYRFEIVCPSTGNHIFRRAVQSTLVSSTHDKKQRKNEKQKQINPQKFSCKTLKF